MLRASVPVVLLFAANPCQAQDPLAILEQRCVACHNPARKKSDLDLTSRELALRGGSKGPALLPGQPDQSLMMALVEHHRTPHMPLREPRLPESEVGALRAWIATGAHYGRALIVPKDASGKAGKELQVTEADRAFWSFAPLRDVAPPQIATPERARTAIDQFWLAQLDASAIPCNPAADPRTLLRRLHLTLTGLPPTAEQVQAFTADHGDAAYQRVVEELLASPHFAERQARHWLDVARYADSGGYEFDHERPHAYPYRDFVIEAFAADLPFDEFVRLQVAADELRPQDPASWRATGFLCAGPTVDNQETEQTRYDEYDDVVSTIGAAFLGLTVGCARCHDHKFDPLPTRDYYRLVAAIAPGKREVRALAEPERLAAFEARRRADEAERTALRRQQDTILAQARERLRRQRAQALPVDASQRELLLGDDPDKLFRYTMHAPGRAWFTEGFDASGWREGAAPFGANRDNVMIGTRWDDARLWARREFHWQGDPEHLAFVAYYDEDVEVYVNGVLAARGQGFTTDYVRLEANAAGRAALRVGKNTLALHCKQTVGGQLLDVVPVDGATLRDDLRAAILTRRDRLLAQHGAALAVNDHDARAALDAQERTQLAKLERAARALADDGDDVGIPRALVMIEHTARPSPAWLLNRGNPADKVEQLEPGFLQVLTPAPAQTAYFKALPGQRRSSGRRAALARWLTDIEHGAGRLLARVIVNRLWQQHFGRGLVATPNDFGLQGERPTHPELLEYLAQELIDGGWRLKPIHRLIVSSAVYRQSSARGPGHERDPSNRAWSRREPMRLDAESVRDAVLATTGCLNRQVFGPSVKPYIHKDAIATGSTLKWPEAVVDGPTTWRRSLYVFMRRSVRFPLLEVFDAPDATASCGRRTPTTTPLQALALLNDTFMRNQAQHFARRVGAGTAEQRIRQAYTLALGRSPSTSELTAGAGFLTAQTARHAGDAQRALVDFCQVMLNLNEFLHVD